MTPSAFDIQNSELPRYAAYKESGVEWLGRVPEHWGVDALRAAVSLKVERNRPDLPVLSVYREYGVILKDSREDNHNATSLDTSAYKVVEPGDLAVNKGIVNAEFGMRNEHLSKGMKAHFLSLAPKNTQHNLNVERVGGETITIPPKEEQVKIIEYIQNADRKTRALNAAVQREIESLKTLRSTLIAHIVTGKLKILGLFSWYGRSPMHSRKFYQIPGRRCCAAIATSGTVLLGISIHLFERIFSKTRDIAQAHHPNKIGIYSDVCLLSLKYSAKTIDFLGI